MGRPESFRSQLLATFSGDTAGRPPWVERIARGDDEGYFGPGSAAWAVHGSIPTLVAGIRALLVQTLHPGAMAGVHDWSRYRDDPLGRLAGTIQWLITVTYADRATATAESTRVGRYHDRVSGTYVDRDGVERAYSAGDPELLSWVHLVFTDAFLRCHELWGDAIPGGADAYVREWATAGELVGVATPPRSEAELRSQLAAFRPALTADDRVADAVRFIRRPPLRRSLLPSYRVLFAGAVASLTDEERRLLGLRRPRWPAITATRLVLAMAARVLGRSSTSEDAARERIARLAATGPAPTDPVAPDPLVADPSHGTA